MRQDEELWMKKVKEMLEGYAEPPPADGWAKLEKELRPTRRIYPLRWWGAAAALVLALSGIGLLFLNRPMTDDAILSEQSQPDIMPVATIQTPDTPQEETTETPEVNTGAVHYAARKNLVASNDKVLPEQTPEEEITVPVEEVKMPTEKKEVSTEKKEEETTRKPSGKDKLHLPAEGTKATAKGNRKGWSVGLALNSGAVALSSGTSYDMSQMGQLSSLDMSNGLVYIPGDASLVFEGDIPCIVKTNEIVEAKHHQPVTFGLTLRKEITSRLSLETGVMYTMLSSDLKLISDPSVAVEQKLHYIGIPVKANWNFIDSKRFMLYASAGGAVEKCVYGKTNGKRNTVDSLQFSLLGGVGAQYNATRKLGIYIEPGVAYFFDDGSDTETIRKDKPFNINLQAGVRLTY